MSSLVTPDKPLGDYKEILLARSTDPEVREKKVGSGGAVTSLLIYMLENNIVDGVVAAKRIKGLYAELVIARNREEVLSAAGSKWSVLPYTTRFREALQDESLRKIALVGLPCQAQFLWQMRAYPLLETDYVSKIHIVISLFCLGTFATEAFIDLLKLKYRLQPDLISSITLEGSYIRIIYGDSEKKIPLQEVLPYVQTGCLVCPDYTGVLSDISAGLSENYPGYTVLVIRSDIGREIVYGAVKEKYIETRKAGADVIEELETKSNGKIVRAMKYMSILL